MINNDIKNLLDNCNKEELEEVVKYITEQLKPKKKQQLCIYKHDCSSESNYHVQSSKHWAKVVKEVDTSKSNGYAFKGDFLKVKGENLVPQDAYVVETCGGSLKLYHVIESHKKEEVLTGRLANFCSFIQGVAEIINS